MNMSSPVCRNKSMRVSSLSHDAPLSHDAGNGRALGQNLTDAANLRPDAFELFFNSLITAVYVVDAIKDCFSISDQRGDDQRRGSAKIGALNCSRTERSFSADDGAAAFHFDVCSHARQFLSVHEAIFK